MGNLSLLSQSFFQGLNPPHAQQRQELFSALSIPGREKSTEPAVTALILFFLNISVAAKEYTRIPPKQKEPGQERLLETAKKIHVNNSKAIPWKAVGRDSAAAQEAEQEQAAIPICLLSPPHSN